MRLFLLFVVLAGCQRQAATIKADDARPPVEAPAPPLPLAKSVTRIKGPLQGEFTVGNSRPIALEPIFVTIDAKNTGTAPLTFEVGGDYRGSYFPIRYGVYVRDETGKKVCDVRETPPMNMGGLGTVRTLAPGESLHETFAINSVCDALATPGRYTVTIVRRFTDQFSAVGTRCDDMLASEGAPPGTTPTCVKFLDAAPMMATDVAIEVRPYNAKSLAVVLDPYVTELASAKDIGDHYDHTLYFQWLCRHVTCSCMSGPAFTTAADLAPFVSTTIAKLPATPTTHCKI